MIPNPDAGGKEFIDDISDLRANCPSETERDESRFAWHQLINKQTKAKRSVALFMAQTDNLPYAEVQ